MKFKHIYSLIIFSALLGILSCSDMNDLHQEYLDKGETIYLGKVDTVIVYPGNERIQMKCVVKSDPKISKLKVTWNNGNDEKIIPYNRQSNTSDTINVDFESIPEGNYVFNFISFDELGNSSIPSEVTAPVYGTKYISKLINKSIDELQAGLSLTIKWKPNSEAINIRVKYVDGSGNEQIIETEEGSDTFIESWKPGSTLEYQTSFKPHENSLDLFYAPVETLTLPEIFMVPKSGFSTVTLPFDVAGDMWGGGIHKLWNGVVSTGDFMHTGAAGDPMPQHITFDMGLLSDLAKLKIEPRNCCYDALPRVFEIWGIDDIEGAATEVNSDDAGWEADMQAKGWTKLARIEQSNEQTHENGLINLEFEEGLPSVRYIRMYFIENMIDETKNFVHMSEATFYATKVYN